jgi:hypothetical protein
MAFDEWGFYQDKNGDIKRIECNGYPINAQEIVVTYLHVEKAARISITAYKFKVLPIRED